MRLVDIIVRIFFPKHCPNCGQIIPIEREFCNCEGKRKFVQQPPLCFHCAMSKQRCICNAKGVITFERITAPFIYTGIIVERIHALKFDRDRRQAVLLGREMAAFFAENLPDVRIDLVTYVPMTKRKQRERGYNQSRLLACAVSDSLFIPIKTVLEKTRDTKNQRKLSRRERLVNLRGAFRVTEESEVCGRSILLIDDVKTTGSTLSECCRLLYEAGADSVTCLCAAVTDFIPKVRRIKV